MTNTTNPNPQDQEQSVQNDHIEMTDELDRQRIPEGNAKRVGRFWRFLKYKNLFTPKLSEEVEEKRKKSYKEWRNLVSSKLYDGLDPISKIVGLQLRLLINLGSLCLRFATFRAQDILRHARGYVRSIFRKNTSNLIDLAYKAGLGNKDKNTFPKKLPEQESYGPLRNWWRRSPLAFVFWRKRVRNTFFEKGLAHFFEPKVDPDNPHAPASHTELKKHIDRIRTQSFHDDPARAHETFDKLTGNIKNGELNSDGRIKLEALSLLNDEYYKYRLKHTSSEEEKKNIKLMKKENEKIIRAGFYHSFKVPKEETKSKSAYEKPPRKETTITQSNTTTQDQNTSPTQEKNVTMAAAALSQDKQR